MFQGKGKAEKGLHNFHMWFSLLQMEAQNLSPEKVAEKVLTESGYLDALEKEGTIESESRLENLEELLRSMREFSEQGDGNTHRLSRPCLSYVRNRHIRPRTGPSYDDDRAQLKRIGV